MNFANDYRIVREGGGPLEIKRNKSELQEKKEGKKF